GAAPAEHEQLALLLAVDDELGEPIGDARHLLGAQTHHGVVVLRVVRHVAGAVLLLDAADAVLETRRAGDRPRPRQGLRVAQIRLFGPPRAANNARRGRG